MSLLQQQIEEIAGMPPAVRVAGYMRRLAELCEYGARLRTTKEDEQWTPEEEAEWDRLADALEPWFRSLSDAERHRLMLLRVLEFLGSLGRGEGPDRWPQLQK